MSNGKERGHSLSKSDPQATTTTAHIISAAEAAINYTKTGLEALPLFEPVSPDVCSCPQGDRCGRSCGKHPRVSGGVYDASSDPAVVAAWWTQYPNANIGIRLDTAGLVDIAPDSPKWLNTFKQLGLPRTAGYTSGDGPGHAHLWYRRPADCPIESVNKSGEFDIMARGYAVAPPSVHRTWRRYRWRVPLPTVLMDLPEAPAWAVQMLHESVRTRVEAAVLPADFVIKAIEPEALIGKQYWRGDCFGGDRSKALWWLAVYLLKEGHDHVAVAGAVAEADVRLGYYKYQTPADYVNVVAHAASVCLKKGWLR